MRDGDADTGDQADATTESTVPVVAQRPAVFSSAAPTATASAEVLADTAEPTPGFQMSGSLGLSLRTFLPEGVTLAVIGPLVLIEMIVGAMASAGLKVLLPGLLLTLLVASILARRDRIAD